MDPTVPRLKDVAYGDHERQVLDLYGEPGDQPAPVFFWVHGGGFRAGDKGNVAPPLLRACADAGIAVVSVNIFFHTRFFKPYFQHVLVGCAAVVAVDFVFVPFSFLRQRHWLAGNQSHPFRSGKPGISVGCYSNSPNSVVR